ncbi:MAG: response regulator transcription factor [Acidimicrobiia bacterium]|nr:response regulator transcription factor [Acidimicrobiia bacterium]
MDDSPGGGQRVLVVDDEPRVREVVATYLQRDGFRVKTAADGSTARACLREFNPDLVVLDLMLPAVSGLTLLRDIRRIGDLPVIVLSARTDEADRVTGLELGADDYVIKPFSPRELVARVHSVMRRATATMPAGPLSFRGLEIDLASRTIQLDGSEIEFTAKEFDLLAFLASHPRKVFRRGQLLEQVWGSSVEWQDPATVTVHVRRLRQKIETDPQAPTRIMTVWGVGYRFEP